MAEIDDDFGAEEEVYVVGSNKDKPKDEVEIEIVDDTPEDDKGKKPLKAEPEAAHEEELDKYSDGVQKRFNQLTHRYHDERRAKEALEKQNHEAVALAQAILAENEKLKQTLTWGQQEYVNEVKAKIDYAQKLAEDKYRRAYESGDTEGVLDAQRALQDVAVQKSRMSDFRPPVPEIEQRENNALQQPQQPVYNQPHIEQQKPQAPVRDPRAEDWASKNPWFGADEEMTSLAYGLHSKLVNSGVDPQSDEYYATIDKRIRDVFPEYFGKTKEKPRTSSPVAPAGRSTASRKVTLNPHQVALAKKLGVPLAEYAKHVAKLEQRNG